MKEKNFNSYGINSKHMTREIIELIFELYDNGASKTEVRDYIIENTPLKRTQATGYASKLQLSYYDNMNSKYTTDNETGYNKSKTQPDENYVEINKYMMKNSITGDYIFLTSKRFGFNITLEEDIVAEIKKRYSNFDGDQHSLNQISDSFGIPRPELIEVLRIMNFTHDSLPIDDDDLHDDSKDAEHIARKLIQEKKSAVNREYKKISWSETQADALTYRKLKHGEFNPLLNGIKVFEPCAKKHTISQKNIDKIKNSQRVAVMQISDPHFGATAFEEELQYGHEWNTDCVKFLL